MSDLYRKPPHGHDVNDMGECRWCGKHAVRGAKCYGDQPVEPDYYEVETDGTSLSGPRFRVVTERPVGPMYAYSPQPLERYAVYRVRLTDGEADNG